MSTETIDILSWNNPGRNTWLSAGGQHSYVAMDLGPNSEEPHYPWFLSREDGWWTRVTSAHRSKDIAEMIERDPSALEVLMHPGPAVQRRKRATS